MEKACPKCGETENWYPKGKIGAWDPLKREYPVTMLDCGGHCLCCGYDSDSVGAWRGSDPVHRG